MGADSVLIAATSEGIAWERIQAGWYEAEAAGRRWRIVQATSSRWEVLRLDPPFASYDVWLSWPNTLAEAKLHVAEEVRALTDPAYAERREARRAARKEARLND